MKEFVEVILLAENLTGTIMVISVMLIFINDGNHTGLHIRTKTPSLRNQFI